MENMSYEERAAARAAKRKSKLVDLSASNSKDSLVEQNSGKTVKTESDENVEEPVAVEAEPEEPVAEEPVAEEPVAEEPVAEEPVAEEPVAEEPVAEEPVAEEPVAEEPVAEEPVAEEPVAEEPVAEEPVAEEPVVEEPSATTPEPVSPQPVEEPIQRVKTPEVEAEKIDSPRRASKRFGASETSVASTDSLNGGDEKPAVRKWKRPEATNKAQADEEETDAQKALREVFEGTTENTWVLLEFPGKTMEIFQQGSGESDQLSKHLSHDKVLYGYLRCGIGAERRTKYVYIRWVGSKVKPIAKAKALNNEEIVKKYIRAKHIEIFAHDTEELSVKKVADKLARAGGANYDSSQNIGQGSVRKGEFSSYKSQSRKFFEQTEKKGTLKEVVFDKGPLAKTTPCDLGGRPMTAAASKAKENIVGY